MNSLRTTLCGRFKSEVVACGVVYAAARRFQVPLPENPPWWKAFDADKSGIDEVCRVLAHLYTLPKAQYIPVCKEGGSFATSNRSWDSPHQSVSKIQLNALPNGSQFGANLPQSTDYRLSILNTPVELITDPVSGRQNAKHTCFKTNTVIASSNITALRLVANIANQSDVLFAD
ncbi:Cyclin-L1-1 [Forsythia ovata]|uniref:Cyclin-L1-1 n=1 Tax=Forsythia ovata TaxID=205694 RepID=A0ABD1SLT0_9LAMI